MGKISVSVGICAYNEERDIGRLLERLLNQKTDIVDIREIIVVSSGSTDRTDEIVKAFSKRDSRVKLVTQPRRMGKASAVNEFLKRASGDICVLESADTIPAQDAVEKLCRPFLDPRVGMTGGRPIPLNDGGTFIGFVGRLLWWLHHRISVRNPKLGELIAFRRVISSIPEDVVVDECYIEAVIKGMSYELKYVPDAIVYNMAPRSISDFLKQRRRIHAGYIQLKKKLGYAPSTLDVSATVREVLRGIALKPSKLPWFLGAIALELLARILGVYDYYSGKKQHVWEVVSATKDLGAAARGVVD